MYQIPLGFYAPKQNKNISKENIRAGINKFNYTLIAGTGATAGALYDYMRPSPQLGG